MKDVFDTIAAIATPPGKGGISIVKISGNRAVEVASRCFRSKDGSKKDLRQYHRQLLYGFAVNPDDNSIIDECILLVMKAPNSYTGEDVVEFQCHGGNIASYNILKLLLSLGVRQAAPGEFTLRAFLNGKKDLVQAEAVNTLVLSTNEFLYKNALLQLKGDFSKKLEEMFENLRTHFYSLEADINFPDDVSVDNDVEVYTLLNHIKDQLIKLNQTFVDTKPLREGIKAVILGKPNVGKSTFLNKILNYERAIVTPHPGTTRDFIVEQINLSGLPLNIIDTAGVRDTIDPVERVGIERTISLLLEADVVFLILDASAPLDEDDTKLIDLITKNKKPIVFALLNKIDRGINLDESSLPKTFFVAKLSLKSGEGLEEFKELFRENILEFYRADMQNEICITVPRHYEIIKTIIDVIEGLQSESKTKDKLLFALKEIIFYYDMLVGRQTPADEIEQIFSNFCIGK